MSSKQASSAPARLVGAHKTITALRAKAVAERDQLAKQSSQLADEIKRLDKAIRVIEA